MTPSPRRALTAHLREAAASGATVTLMVYPMIYVPNLPHGKRAVRVKGFRVEVPAGKVDQVLERMRGVVDGDGWTG